MMKRLARLAAALTAPALWLAAVGAGAQAADESVFAELSSIEDPRPAMWKVSDADSTVWIFGSVHILPPNVDWRRPALMAALEEADYVYFEAPTDAISQFRLQSLVAREGFYGAERSLLDALSPAGRERLREICAALGTEIDSYLPMRPWLAYTALTYQMMVAEGGDPNQGVDAQMALAAARAGKELRHFETLEQQTMMLAGMPEDAQAQVLETTLEQFDEGPQQMLKMLRAWLAGDLTGLEQTVFADSGEMPQSFSDDMFTNRNLAWAETLDAFLDGAGDALVVVGAAHMVGEDDLIDLLRARGWTVERL